MNATPPTAETSPATDLDFRWSAAAYEQLGSLGILTPADQVELLEGVILRKEMNHPPHARAVALLNRHFSKYPERGLVRGQAPVALDESSLTEPDLALVRLRADLYADQHPGPTDVFLLVEVANTSPERDRGSKLARYAQAGIPEYWIVNLPGRRVEVYRRPDQGAATYGEISVCGAGDTLALAAFPDAALAVAELFAPAAL